MKMPDKKPVSVALLGAGSRGELNLGTLARRYPGRLRFVAVAEPLDARREGFVGKFGLDPKHAFRDWRELMDRPRLADAIINTLPCRMHFESTMAGLEAGYDILLEKPMALTPGQSIVLTETAAQKGCILAVSLQCRLNKIYTRMRGLMDQSAVGDLMNIDCAENIGYWHFVMSYVRGIHHHSSLSHSFIMAKGIHDVDLIKWFAGAPAKRVSSFGSLKFFNQENAPEGAPERCMDGCPVEKDCIFSAIKQYLDPGQPAIPLRLMTGQSLDAVMDVIRLPRFRTLGSVVSPEDISDEGIKKALSETNYGRCVFRCPNDVVDHQTVSIEFENGVTASFSLSGFSVAWERTLNLHGTKGEIRSADFSGRLETRTYRPARISSERIRYHGIIHGGGDTAIILKFADAVAENNPDKILTTAPNVLESHLICFAAEKARMENRVIEMDEFRKKATEEAEEIRAGMS
jgi:predicted dehydrogenase